MTDPHCITAGDIPSLGKLLNGIFRYGNNVRDQDVLTDFPLVFAPANSGNCRVIVVDERIVSHAAIFPCDLIVNDVRLKTAVIVLVATDPDYRKRGFAAQLMRDLQQKMHDDAYDLGILWTGVPAFYRKLGWEVVMPRGWLIDDLRSQPELIRRAVKDITPTGTVAIYDESKHLDGIVRLHDRERIRIKRSQKEYATLLTLPKINLWVLHRDSEVAAYVVVGQATNKHGLIEYGCSVDDILSLTDHVLRHQQLDRELPFLIYPTRDDLGQRFLDSGESLKRLECSKGRGCEMVYIVQADRVPSEVRDNLFVWGLDFT